MTRFRLAGVLVVALALVAVGCEKKQQPAPTEKAVAKPAQETPPEKAPQPGAEKAQPSHTSSIPATMNQMLVDEKVPDVSLEIVSPKEDEVLSSGDKVEARFKVKNYRMGKEIGQHIHVIVDNNPYIAHYDADKPLVLKNLAPGTHTLRVFPARHYHLSLKKGDVFKTRIFHVQQKTKDFGFDPTKPFVTYSRPKGTYSMQAGKDLLLDFYVSNATLGKDAKVIYGVDGKETTLTEWKPVILDPLQPGQHKITLKLVDMNGKLIENGGYNNTTRTITVKGE